MRILSSIAEKGSFIFKSLAPVAIKRVFSYVVITESLSRRGVGDCVVGKRDISRLFLIALGLLFFELIVSIYCNESLSVCLFNSSNERERESVEAG